jgi:hypothetical protein
MPRRKRGATDREHVVLVCPCCDRLLWPRTYTNLMRRERRNVFALLIGGKKGGGWKTRRALAPDELHELFDFWKRRLLFTVQAWMGLGWLTDADFAFVGSVTQFQRHAHVETTREQWTPSRIEAAIPLPAGPMPAGHLRAAEGPQSAPKRVTASRSVLRV